MDKYRQKMIKEILYNYVKQESISDSIAEKDAEKYFITFFSKQAYFKKNPELLGTFPIKGDRYNRAVAWAMRKGEGADTVVLIHHNDVVAVDNYKLLREYAFAPDALAKRLFEIKDRLPLDVKLDLESGEYLFGRGVCDMKGGGSIQMALLTEYAKQQTFKGNVIVVGLPDEENLSAGMHAAITLLNQLKDKYKLAYKLMINSEPHQRKIKEEGIFSFGSIGKIMPYLSVRGFLAHAGKVFEGLNPVNIMAEIVRNTETNMALSDTVEGEAAPPPTWLYLKDNKMAYDVSMPLSINGCLSVQTLNQSPAIILDKIKKITEQSFAKVIKDLNANYQVFLEATNQSKRDLPWQVKVVYFRDLCAEAEKNYDDRFSRDYEQYLAELKTRIDEGDDSLISANFKLVDFVYNYIDDLSPTVVIGLVPPYYPNVSNLFYDGDEKIANLYDKLSSFVKQTYDQIYTHEYYYTGISDLSYSYVYDSAELEDSLSSAMPLWGEIYHLPIHKIKNIRMPCVNIGPWGKDFHKMTERVYKQDLFERTPRILDYAIRYILE